MEINEKVYVETKQYSVSLVPLIRDEGFKKAKNKGKTFSAYINALIEKDLKEKQ